MILDETIHRYAKSYREEFAAIFRDEQGKIGFGLATGEVENLTEVEIEELEFAARALADWIRVIYSKEKYNVGNRD